MTPRKYRKKPVEVEALQFTRGQQSALAVVKWIQSNGGQASYETVTMDTTQGLIPIKTLEGTMYAAPGDFIIRGVRGEFYPCKPDIFALTYERVSLAPVVISDANRAIMEQAWDDGDNTVRLEPGENAPWFVGMHEDFEVCEGLEHDGVLYVAVHQSGGGLVSVIEGEGLISNDAGVTFHSMAEAKAYIQGRIAE